MTERDENSLAQPALLKLPEWLNPYQLEAWVKYRDLAAVAAASDWLGLSARHLYGALPRVGNYTELMTVLRGGQLPSEGRKGGAEFEPIRPVEWTRIALAPLDLSQQHPYLQIMFKREDVLALFPATVSMPLDDSLDGQPKSDRSVPTNRQLDHDWILNRAREMLAERPSLFKGSAAAAIVAELPPNPRTGKPRDIRHIERKIAGLWGGF